MTNFFNNLLTQKNMVIVARSPFGQRPRSNLRNNRIKNIPYFQNYIFCGNLYVIKLINWVGMIGWS